MDELANFGDIQSLANFIYVANKHTYANAKAKKVKSTRLGSKDYEFIQGDFIFHDTYFGSKDFIGEEIVYYKNKPVWGMNYYGVTLNYEQFNITPEDIYTFLRKALMADYKFDIKGHLPLRGPTTFSEGNYEYNVNFPGSLQYFVGTEEIFYKKELVHKVIMHGGLIK